MCPLDNACTPHTFELTDMCDCFIGLQLFAQFYMTTLVVSDYNALFGQQQTALYCSIATIPLSKHGMSNTYVHRYKQQRFPFPQGSCVMRGLCVGGRSCSMWFV